VVRPLTIPHESFSLFQILLSALRCRSDE